jgi:hypothetical protein
MLRAMRLRALVLMVGVAVALAPGVAVAAPPTLTGEVLSDPDPSVTGSCNPTGTSTVAFQSAGVPSGPYAAGSFVETGAAAIGPQPPYEGGGSFVAGEMTAFAASFLIETPGATITGVKMLDASSDGSGACRQVTSDPDIGNAKLVSAGAPLLTYEARIVTAEGTFVDRGRSALEVRRFTTDLAFPFASFSETFQSSLTEPFRVPTSHDDCRNGGYQQFPELEFKSQGDCISYVNRSGS